MASFVEALFGGGGGGLRVSRIPESFGFNIPYRLVPVVCIPRYIYIYILKTGSSYNAIQGI